MHLSNPMHQIQTLDWPHFLLKAHGLKPILVAPQPTKSILSSAFSCEISSVLLGCPCPLCAQTCQCPSHGSVTMPCWSFQTARKPSMSSSEKKCQPGSGLLEITRGKKKVKAELRAGWCCSLNSELFLHLSSRHQLSPVGAITLPCLPGLINLYLPHQQSAKWLFEHYLLLRNPCLTLRWDP